MMWIVLHGIQLTLKCENVCPSAKESEDKENLPKRTSAGGFKFTFSHSAGAANGANGANGKSVAAQTSPASSNGSSSKNAALSGAVTAAKVGALGRSCRPAAGLERCCVAGSALVSGQGPCLPLRSSRPCLAKPCLVWGKVSGGIRWDSRLVLI